MYVGNGQLPYNMMFVTGACRTGKTTLSRILGSLEHVEWIEEPYELSLLLWSMGYGKADDNFTWEKQIFTGICKELINDTILLRRGNFRPGDLSTLWNYKEGKEIFERLVNLNTRQDVKEYLKAANRKFVIDIPNILGQANFIKQNCKNMVLFHVVRNPYDIAQAVYEKHWYSDENIRFPSDGDNTPCRKYAKDGAEYCIPWWLEEGREEEFIDAAEYERGVIYWLSVEKSSGEERTTQDFLIKYEDLVSSTGKVLDNICSIIEGCPTGRTMALCSELHDKFIVGQRRPVHLSAHYQSRLEQLKEMYGYE
ncbi:MAG TPA: hypothetical protein DCR27_06340 [Lachnospiraceae bacterium]|nr:hypothetical protein [Lachnospiraceae bacterium]